MTLQRNASSNDSGDERINKTITDDGTRNDTTQLLEHAIDIDTDKVGDKVPQSISTTSSTSLLQRTLHLLNMNKSRVISITCLFALTIQNISIALLMRYSRGVLKEDYIITSSVMTGELIKLLICFIITMIWYENMSIKSTIKRLRCHMGLQTSLPLIVPALCYFCQNILSNAALNVLDAFTYQSLQQMRILTTAAFAIILIGKQIVAIQWRALALLILGLSLVLWKQSSPSTTASPDSTNESAQQSAAYLLGIIMVLTQATLSGFAGVYFEAVLKSQGNNIVQRFFKSAAQAIESLFSNTNDNINDDNNSTQNNNNIQTQPTLWDRNFQLAAWSLILGIIILLLNVGDDLSDTLEFGYYHSWSRWTVAVCLVQSCGGLLIALVVQYTDNIVKGFAMACAMCLSPIMSVQLFNEQMPTYPNIAGMLAVVLSCFNYSDVPAVIVPSQDPASSIVTPVSSTQKLMVNGYRGANTNRSTAA